MSRGAEWARSQHLGSTLSLGPVASDAEMSESSSHSSLASAASALSVRPKDRMGGTGRRPRVNSQGRESRRGGATGSLGRTTRSSKAAAQNLIKAPQKSLDVASDSE